MLGSELYRSLSAVYFALAMKRTEIAKLKWFTRTQDFISRSS